MPIRNIGKERAEDAYKNVEKVVKENGKSSKTSNEYKAYVKKIPTMIQTNGLNATLAFLYSKKKTYEIVYNQIDDFLRKQYKNDNEIDNDRELVEKILTLNSSAKYKKITIDVLSLLGWLKRFAEGMIEKEKKDG
jgi:CRISPR-associated protein Cmr5